VRAKVASLARAQGATHLTAEDLDGITIDACLDLARRAGSWDPDGGAMPWVWGERLLRSIVARYVGQYGVILDEAAERKAEREAERRSGGAMDPAFGADDSDDSHAGAILDRLAARRPEYALLADALAWVATLRTRGI